MSTDPAPSSRRQNRRGEGARLKEELVQSALRLLDRSPRATLSVRVVAAEAGVAAPSIYSQYPDVQAMLADVVRECWRQLGEALVSDSTDTVELSPRDLLQARMAAYVRYAMERPSRYQLLFAPPVDTARFPDLPGLLQPAYRAIYFPVAALLEQGCTLPVKDPEAATLMIISMAHGRIAVAHLAPKRAGNSILGVQQFVATTLDRLLAQ